MKRFAFLACLVLAACGSGNNSESNDRANAAASNHGYGLAFDVQGASGLKLRFTPTQVAGSALADVGRYEAAFAEVEQCTGMTAPAPFVILLARGDLGPSLEGSNRTGLYWSQPGLVLIAEDTNDLKHEFIHYLLDHATGDLDVNHTSPLFERCQAFTQGSGAPISFKRFRLD